MTDFFLKLISPIDSAQPLLFCSFCIIDKPFTRLFYHFATPTTSFQINTSLVSRDRPFIQAAPLETNTSLLQHLTAESSRELMSSEEYCSALRKPNNKLVMFLLLLFKLSFQLPFVASSFLSISIFSLLPFSILSLLPFLISTSLSTIPSFSSDRFSFLLR